MVRRIINAAELKGLVDVKSIGSSEMLERYIAMSGKGNNRRAYHGDSEPVPHVVKVI